MPESEEKNRILTVDVILDASYRIEEKVQMILFHGSASGPYFSGEILPGGVDTQKKDADGKWFLSARYMLKGRDAKGNPAQIFIQNDGTDADGKLRTKPAVLTDDPELLWMETAELYGEVAPTPDGVRILIFGVKN